METLALQQPRDHLHGVGGGGGGVGHQQPENWLYEIKQKSPDHSTTNTCYVMVQNDLVKSHLMFAVREEVEVLKEKISELMDRINQLEYENNILKQNASQETLSQLTPSGTPSAAQSAQSSSAVAAAAATVAAALTPLAKSQAAAAAAAAAVAPAASAGTPTVNPNANGSVS